MVHFTTGTATLVELTTLTTYVNNSVIEIKCGYDHLALNLVDPSRTVSSWDIFLVDKNGNTVSELRSFVMDYTPHEYQRNFFFRNSFSAYESVRMIGESEVNVDYERVVGSQVRVSEFTRTYPPLKQFSVAEIQSFKTNSGWVSKDVKNVLREMLLSMELYEVVDDNFLPVLITSTKLTAFFKDGEYLYNLEMEYQRAYKDEYFSPLVLPSKWRDSATWQDEQTWSDLT